MTKLAFDLWSTYDIGVARGRRSQLSAMGITRDAFYRAFGEAVNRLGPEHRDELDRRGHFHVLEHPEEANDAYRYMRFDDEAKRRWVDGTPEYSINIPALVKLFPKAQFIHLIRDVDSVVRSLMTFEAVGGPRLVETEQEAYEYWLRTVSGCLEAERSFGTEVVLRIRYADLVRSPSETLGRCLDFLGEPFAETCLEPLRTRVNASKTPSEYPLGAPGTDPEIVRRSTELSCALLAEERPFYARDQARVDELERQVQSHGEWVGSLEALVEGAQAEAVKLGHALSGLEIDNGGMSAESALLRHPTSSADAASPEDSNHNLAMARLKEAVRSVIAALDEPRSTWLDALDARMELYGVSERPGPGTLNFTCNICRARAATRIEDLGRETRSCPECGSTARSRAVVHVLSMELFGASFALDEFPDRRDLRGLGLTDWAGYATRLAEKLDYVNTFYDREPRLDITAIDPAIEGSLDFLIASDVFEHVAPPVSHAFENARRLLKPNGVLVLTVPYGPKGATVEHFPELHDYELVEREGRPMLRNVTKAGVAQEFNELIFHGGPGFTLELRQFSEKDLLGSLGDAGFREVRIYSEPRFDYGIYWGHDRLLPVAARPQ